MKLLFYVSHGDGRVAHLLATGLKESVGDTEISVLAYREFVEGQYLRGLDEALFSRIYTSSEIDESFAASDAAVDAIQLAEYESRYGKPTLWQHIIADRKISMERRGRLYRYGTDASREYLLGLLVHRIQSLEQLLEEYRPDAIVYCGFDTGPPNARLLSTIARAKNIPVLVPTHTRLKDRMIFNDRVENFCPVIARRYRELMEGDVSPRKEDARRFLDDYRQGFVKPSYIESTKDSGTNRRKTTLSEWALNKLKSARRAISYLGDDDVYRTSYLARQLDNAVVKMRRTWLERSDLFAQPNLGEKFVLFPMHVEPELALLVYAPFWRNQFAVIQNVAQSMPADTTLYVKDHVVGLGTRNPSYYEKLVRIPNVRLIHPEIPARKLINDAQGVVAITGTAALEAALLGKPAVTFGDVYFNIIEGHLFNIKAMEELPDVASKFGAVEPDEQSLISFLASVLEVSQPLDLRKLKRALRRMAPNRWENIDEGRRLVNAVRQRLTA